MKSDRILLISSESSLELQLINHYVQKLDARIMEASRIPFEFLYPELPKGPFMLGEHLVLPIRAPMTNAELALMKAAEEYDPAKSIVNGSRMEWPVWRPHARPGR